jgi:hypothetical protein
MPAVPSPACRCPRPASGVQCLVRVSSSTRACPRGRCPVRASERPDVRCPVSSVGVWCTAWVSGVRGFPRPLCPAGRWWRGGGGRRRPHGWDGRRRCGRLRCPRPVRRLPWSEPGGRGWRRSAGSAEGRLGLGRRRGRWFGCGEVDRVGDQDWLDGRGDRPLVASRGAQRGGDYAAWSSCEAWAGSPGRRVAGSLRAFWAGLRLARAAVVRPQPAVSAACSTLAAL